MIYCIRSGEHPLRPAEPVVAQYRYASVEKGFRWEPWIDANGSWDSCDAADDPVDMVSATIKHITKLNHISKYYLEMSVDVRTEVLFLLKCAEDVDDQELLHVIEGIRQKDPNKIPYIQDALMKRNKGESIRVARLLLRTPPNQPSTVTRVQPPSQSLSPSERPRSEAETNNKKENTARTVLKQHQKRLRVSDCSTTAREFQSVKVTLVFARRMICIKS